MPRAFKCGISEEEFWEDDVDILRMKMEAYQSRVDEEAFMHGFYVREALLNVVSSAFSKSKTEIYQFPTEPLSVSRKKMQEESKKSQERVFRDAVLNCY